MSDSLQGHHLHFDCVSGIAGDMTLGALIDLGVPAQIIRDAIEAVGLGDDRLRVEPVVKSGISATNVWVRCDDERGEHSHYHYSDIKQRIESSSLDRGVIELSIKIFDCVAIAEAKLHGTTVEKVAFHEVGAIDSIVDVVGSAAALHWLSPTSVSASPVAMGRGTIRCAHGILPVPSPAAVEILRVASAPVTDGGIDKELCTPTGAAILAAIVDQWGGMPQMVPLQIGYGAGDLEFADRANVLRAMVGRRSEPASEAGDSVIEIEANIDDMNPEFCDFVAEQLFAAGAVDVWWTAITMKKGRPAIVLRVLCSQSNSQAIMAVVLRETTSIGLRFQRKQRLVLDREIDFVDTIYGSIAVKLGRLDGAIVNIAPEFESCKRQALAHNVPLKRVFAAAMSQWNSLD